MHKSDTIVSNLLEFLYGTLTPSDMQWLGEHLIEHAQSQKENLKPYTMEEIDAMIDESERQIAAGLCQDNEDVFRELQEELEQEEPALSYAEAV